MIKRKNAYINIPSFLIDGSNRLENYVLNNINIYKKRGYRSIWFNVVIGKNQELSNVFKVNGIQSHGVMFDGSFHHERVFLNPTWIDRIIYRLK